MIKRSYDNFETAGPCQARDLGVGEEVVLGEVEGQREEQVEPGVEDEVGDGDAVELARGEADLGPVVDGPGVLMRAELPAAREEEGAGDDIRSSARGEGGSGKGRRAHCACAAGRPAAGGAPTRHVPKRISSVFWAMMRKLVTESLVHEPKAPPNDRAASSLKKTASPGTKISEFVILFSSSSFASPSFCLPKFSVFCS